MHPRLYPPLEEDVIEGVGGAHRDIGAADRLFRLLDRNGLDAQSGLHVLSE